MKEYLSYMLGEFSIIWYGACFSFSFIGQFLRWAFTAQKAVICNPNTPNVFSWEYWWEHNTKPKLVNFFVVTSVVFCALRFAPELFNTLPTMFYALCTGLALDFIIDYMRKLGPKFLEFIRKPK